MIEDVRGGVKDQKMSVCVTFQDLTPTDAYVMSSYAY